MRPDDGRVISNFIVQALHGEPITIYGDGSQTRSFCFVDDLIDGIVKLMDAPDEVTGPMNLGNPTEFTIAQLADLVVKMTGAKSQIEYRPLPTDDPMQRCPDISLAKRALGWEPTIPLAKGLEQTIAYFKTIV